MPYGETILYKKNPLISGANIEWIVINGKEFCQLITSPTGKGRYFIDMVEFMIESTEAESESMSGNIIWGKRQTMKESKVVIQYKHFCGYEKSKDGKPRIIPEQADVIRQIYKSFLAGRSVRMIKHELEPQDVPATQGGNTWSESVIRRRLSLRTASPKSKSAMWDSSPCA